MKTNNGRRHFPFRSMAAVATLAAASLALVATPAHAGPPRGNCVGDLTGRTEIRCYATLTEAMSVATRGRLTNAPASGAKAFRSARFDAGVNAANAGSVQSVSSSDV